LSTSITDVAVDSNLKLPSADVVVEYFDESLTVIVTPDKPLPELFFTVPDTDHP
jgi:hypothetical protein